MKITEVTISNAVFGSAGLLLGIISPAIARASGFPAYAIVPVIAAIFFLKFGIEKAAKIKQPMGWWMSNGIMLCILLWFVSWTIIYNM